MNCSMNWYKKSCRTSYFEAIVANESHLLGVCKELTFAILVVSTPSINQEATRKRSSEHSTYTRWLPRCSLGTGTLCSSLSPSSSPNTDLLFCVSKNDKQHHRNQNDRQTTMKNNNENNKNITNIHCQQQQQTNTTATMTRNNNKEDHAKANTTRLDNLLTSRSGSTSNSFCRRCWRCCLFFWSVSLAN